MFDDYGATSAAVFTDEALDAKTRELIALAVAVAKQCDGGIASHARGAARRGATVDETLGVAFMMNGGPGTAPTTGLRWVRRVRRQAVSVPEPASTEIAVGDKENRDAAWYYPEPSPAAREITGRVAFWRGVTVERVGPSTAEPGARDGARRPRLARLRHH